MNTIKYQYEEFCRKVNNPKSYDTQCVVAGFIGLLIFCLLVA